MSFGAELLSPYARRAPLPAALPLAAPGPLVAVDASQKRSPLLCGYPSKKCWSWRVEKRNGELHKFCEYHRQKANTNQRRMEQRRKLGQGKARPSPRASHGSAKTPAARSTAATVAAVAGPPPLKVECIEPPKVKSEPLAFNVVHLGKSSVAAASGSPRGIDAFDASAAPSAPAAADPTAAYSWMDVELDVGLDAAVEYMMFDHVLALEPSDKPVDLYEEDLFFLEHFINEISHSAV